MAAMISSYIESAIEESISVKRMLLDSKSILKMLEQVADSCVAAMARGNKIILAGNGGSAADAQHIAAEFVSRFEFDRPGLAAVSLSTDTSMLTAIGNDYGFENIFARQLQANARKGDIFIGITTSGRSENILKGLEYARAGELITVGMTGNNSPIRFGELCDYCISVPSAMTARIQEAHIMVGHVICGVVERKVFGG